MATRSVCQDQPGRVYLLLASQASRTPTWVDAGTGLPRLPQYRLVLAGSAQPRAYALTSSGLWMLDLPAPPTPATPTPKPGPTAAADDAPQPPPPAPVPVQVPQGEVKETAVGSAIDYALVFVALAVGAIVLLRWLIRRHG